MMVVNIFASVWTRKYKYNCTRAFRRVVHDNEAGTRYATVGEIPGDPCTRPRDTRRSAKPSTAGQFDKQGARRTKSDQRPVSADFQTQVSFLKGNADDLRS
jgi:hypothetical protein